MTVSAKDRILFSAFKLFLEKGFAGVSTSDIKREAGVSTGNFYHHFKTKEDLIVTVMEKYIFDFFDSSLEAIREFDGDFKDNLYYLLIKISGYDIEMTGETSFYSQFEISDFRRIHLLYLEGIQKYEIMRDRYCAFNLMLLDYIKEIVLDGQSKGEIIDMDSDDLAKFIQSTINGTFLMWVSVPDYDFVELMRINIDSMWDFISVVK